jgi:hypothetical protein
MRRIDGEGHEQKDDAERKRQRNFAFRGLQRYCSGHGAGHMVDIAAHDHHGADLGDGPPEAREHGGD